MPKTQSKYEPDKSSRLSFTEPRICLDDNCSLAFGLACPECSSAFDAQQMGTRVADPDGRESNRALIPIQTSSLSPDPNQAKIESLNSCRPVTSNTRFGFVSSCLNVDLSSLTSSQTQYKETDTAVSTPALACPVSLSSEDEAESGQAINLEFSYSSSSESTTDSRLLNPLNPWLSELFSNTLKAQLEGTHFTGGAEDQNTTLDFCPICHAPLGDPRDQHFLRCQYAHEEQARMKEFVARSDKRARE